MKPKNGESQMEVDSNGQLYHAGRVLSLFFYISGKPEESDSENEDDPEDEEVIDKIRDRLPDDEEVLNEFLVRSLAIFMLLRNVSLSNSSLRILQARFDAYVFP